MQITYKLPDGNLVYDVVESVVALSISLSTGGTPISAQVVRRRQFYISGTLVKESSDPAQQIDLAAFCDVVLLPTALTISQILTALLLRLLQNAPELVGRQDLVIPTLPDDLGAQADRASRECLCHDERLAEYQRKLSQADADLSNLDDQIEAAKVTLHDLRNDTQVVALTADNIKIQLSEEIKMLESKKNDYNDTLARLENAIQEYSEQSTALQLKNTGS